MGMASGAIPPNPFGNFFNTATPTMYGSQPQCSQMQAAAQMAVTKAMNEAASAYDRMYHDQIAGEYAAQQFNKSPKPSEVAKTAASRVAVVETEDDRKDYEVDKLLHEVYTRKEQMMADRERILAAYKKDEE